MQDSLKLAHECVHLYHTALFVGLVTVLALGIAAVTLVKMLIDRNRPDCPCEDVEYCDEGCECDDCLPDCDDDCDGEVVASGSEEDEHADEPAERK